VIDIVMLTYVKDKHQVNITKLITMCFQTLTLARNSVFSLRMIL